MGGLRVGRSAVLGDPPQAGVGLRLKSEVVLKLSGSRDLGGIPNDGESWSLEQGEIRGSTEGKRGLDTRGTNLGGIPDRHYRGTNSHTRILVLG